jgi:hypothetical protein
MRMTRKNGLAAQAAFVMGAALLAATPLSAQTAPVEPVKVGIIDTTVGKLMMGYKDIPIERRTFVGEGRTAGEWSGMIGYSHGEIVASSFVERSREISRTVPIAIYSANAFFQGEGRQDSDGNRPLRIDFAGAERALEWFHEKGVRTVVAAFYSNESAAMRSFVEKARKLDIVLFAGTNNDKTSTIPFPARDPYAIAVTGTNANLDFSNNPSMAGWTSFKMNGDTPTNDLDPTQENGSSFAVAKAAAFGAHYLPEKSTTCDMDGKATMKRFRMALASLTAADVRTSANVRIAFQDQTASPPTPTSRDR